MKRHILNKLLAWKRSKMRKPLILMGARQVGKTYALEAFAKAHYPAYHYFNFEKTPAIHSIFNESLEPYRILQALSLAQGRQINVEDDLVIFDEIQACPKALTSLKYFCEDQRNLHLCAAGSLLGVHLGEQSYPVGKVDHLDMHPMTFSEFLMALGDDMYVELLASFSEKTLIPEVAHQHLWKRLLHYFVVGGLPEVVDMYCQHQDEWVTAFELVRKKQNDLITDYFNDISKHSGKINAMQIDRIWKNIPEQLALAQDGTSRKFKFKGVIPGVDRYAKMANAIDWLEASGLILKQAIINKPALPLKAYAKENAFKLFIFDVGLLGALSNISPKTILEYDYGSYKGFFAENYVAQALSAAGHDLFCWMNNTSEVEFLWVNDEGVIPVEVKSGQVTQAKSLQVYAGKYHPERSVVLSARPLSIQTDKRRHYIPLYLAEQLSINSDNTQVCKDH